MHPYDRVIFGLLAVFIALAVAELVRWVLRRRASEHAAGDRHRESRTRNRRPDRKH